MIEYKFKGQILTWGGTQKEFFSWKDGKNIFWRYKK